MCFFNHCRVNWWFVYCLLCIAHWDCLLTGEYALPFIIIIIGIYVQTTLFFMTSPMQLFQDRQAAFQLLATMYIKYIQIMRRLEQCYDQIVQPQKRRVLRHCLDGVMGRILELKNEMIDLEFSEYHYFDDVLSDLKLTPVSDQSPNTVTLWYAPEWSK